MGKTFDVAAALRAGYTQKEITEHVKVNGLDADTSGVADWRREQRAIALASAPPAHVAAERAANARAGAAPPDASAQRGVYRPPVEAGHWTDPLPTVMGGAAGLLTAPLSPLASIPAAGVGQALGSGLNMKARQMAGLSAPEGEAAGKAMLREGVMGAGAQALGLGAGAVMGRVGEGLASSAMRDPVSGRALVAERGVVGRPWLGWRSAVDIGNQGMKRVGAQLDGVIAEAEAAGLGASPRGFEAVLRSRVQRAAKNKTSDPQTYNYWRQRLAQWLRGEAGTTSIPPSRLNVIRVEEGDKAKALYESRSKFGAGGPKDRLDEKYSKELADWSRRELDNMTAGHATGGTRTLNAQYERYRRMEKAARIAHEPRAGAVSPETSMSHARQYGGGHSIQLPSLPPDLTSRLAMLSTAAPTTFGVRALPWAVDLGMSTGLARNYQPPVPQGESVLTPEMRAILGEKP